MPRGWRVRAPRACSGRSRCLWSSRANFGIPAVLGFPARYFVLTTRIYGTILNFDLKDNLRIAAALAMWLVAIAAVLLTVQRRMLPGRRFTVAGGEAGQPLGVA